jgi:hypothetical protein
MASAARNARLRPVLLASFWSLVFAERSMRTENVSVLICLQYSTQPCLVHAGMRTEAGPRADALKFTSRILEVALGEKIQRENNTHFSPRRVSNRDKEGVASALPLQRRLNKKFVVRENAAQSKHEVEE